MDLFFSKEFLIFPIKSIYRKTGPGGLRLLAPGADNYLLIPS